MGEDERARQVEGAGNTSRSCTMCARNEGARVDRRGRVVVCQVFITRQQAPTFVQAGYRSLLALQHHY